MTHDPKEGLTRRALFCAAHREMTTVVRDAATLAQVAAGHTMNTLMGKPAPDKGKKKP